MLPLPPPLFFFFNDTATTEIYTLSLHDALPIFSFPVAGTLMIEPTESEPKAELDRFVDALIAIREEIREIEAGAGEPATKMLQNAPHPPAGPAAENWERPHAPGARTPPAAAPRPR